MRRHFPGARRHTLEQLEPRVLLAAVTREFADVAGGYAGTRDTHLRQDSPSGSFGGASIVVVDLDDNGATGNQPSQGLVRFDGLFGTGATQVPPGTAITAATLTLHTGSASSDDSITTTSLYRMLRDWGESSTWDGLVGGVSANGAEAASTADGTVSPSVLGGAVVVDVRATVQAWSANPAASFGWALLPNGTNGWRLNSSEATDPARRPKLTITYETSQTPSNQAPSVSAGSDLAVTLPASASLDGTVTDDGLPNPPGTVSTGWTRVSGPGTVTFGNASAVDTTASFSAAGTYVLRLTANDGEFTRSDDVSVVVNAAPQTNQAPVVVAGPDLVVTLSSSATLDGTVTDDGLPNPPGRVSTTWSRFSGPGTVTFANASAVDTTASFSAAGTYVLRLTANDGQFARSDDATITVQSGPATPTTQQLNSVSTTENTGEKPQSKVWKYAGAWWSVFPNASGTWVWRLDNTTWNPVFRINTRTAGKADVLPVGDVAHVLLFDGSSSTRLASLQYVPGSPGTYAFWSQRATVPTIPLGSGVEMATLAMDGAGRMWVASDAGSTIEVRYSDGNYSTWSAPVTIGSGVTTDDICDITTLPNGSVGVIWSNQNTERFGFRTHAAGAAPTSWSTQESPASQSALNVGAGFSDDHMSLAVTSTGAVYAAVKTSYDTSGHPVIGLLVRRPTGVWDNFYSVDTDLGATRPIVVVNESQGVLMVAYRNGSHDIVYRQAPLSNPGSFGSRRVIITRSVNNVSSTRQVLTSDAVFLATDYPSDNVVRSVRLVWPSSPPSSPSGSTMSASTASSSDSTEFSGGPEILEEDTEIL